MGAWDDLTLTDLSTLKAAAARVFHDRAFGGFGEHALTAELKTAAKGLVQDKLLSSLGDYLGAYDTLDLFFDAVAGAGALGGLLQRALSFAAVHFYAYDHAHMPDEEDAFYAASMKALGMLEGVLSTIAKVARHVLLTTARTLPVAGTVAVPTKKHVFDLPSDVYYDDRRADWNT